MINNINNTIEEIIVEEFNEHYKDKFKNIRTVVNDINKAKGWRVRFKILKKLLKTLPRTEFTLLKGRYRGNFLVYYTVSNRFSIRQVDFLLKDLYSFVNGRYTLVDFENNIENGCNIFKNENIYLILQLEKLEEVVCSRKVNEINIEEKLMKIKSENLIFETDAKNENLIFEDDDFIINNEKEAIILDNDLTEEEIAEILRDFQL